MKAIVVMAISCLLIGCANNKKSHPEGTKHVSSAKSASEILNAYFSKFEIEPAIIVNNIEGNQTQVQISNHKIRWINTGKETQIKIDNDLFSLKDKVTLNEVNDNQIDSVYLVNNWDEMKLFKVNNKEEIGIRMSYQPCTGLGCNVDYFLIYDVATRSKNFFGTFYTDNELTLYDFNNDRQLDYIAKTFNGDPNGFTPMNFIYKLYSMANKGEFIEQRDSSGKPYQLVMTTFPNDTTKAEQFEQHWLTVIK